MPSDVNEKMKTTPALEAIEARSIGIVTVTNALSRVAPSVLATVS